MEEVPGRPGISDNTVWTVRLLGPVGSRRRAVSLGVLAGAVGVLILSNAVAALSAGADYRIQFFNAVGWMATFVFLMAVLALIAGFATLHPSGFDNSWSRIDKISSSGGFYFFAGICLLLYAIHMTQTQLHPSLTFLLAMLGVAITLFGTGSQAVGALATSGAPLPDARTALGAATVPGDAALDEVKKAVRATAEEAEKALALGDDAARAAALSGVGAMASSARDKTEKLSLPAPVAVGPPGDWKPIKANAAVAGGAAVLTALFGWGVIYFRSEIKDVFGFYDRYLKIRIETCAVIKGRCSDVNTSADALASDFNLMDYSISADLINGSPVYSIASGNEIQLLIFAEAIEQNNSVRLHIVRQRENEKIGPEVDRDVRVHISATSLKARRAGDKTAAGKGSKGPRAPECAVYASNDEDLVDQKKGCSLYFDDSATRGDEVYVIQYSLNFFQNADIRNYNTVNDLQINFL